jgi:D-alanine-D-alanine ligase
MTEVDPEWWKTLFDDTYLVTDARSVCDDGITCREVDFLEQRLKLETPWPILDLCGGHGRHALELSRRGFKDVTVLDYSHFLLSLGHQRARGEGLSTHFVRNDARSICLPNQTFKIIIIMASSFGYLEDEADDEYILRETCRLLAPDGCLLMDLPDEEYVAKHFSPLSWHEASEDVVVCRKKTMEGNVICGREMVICKKKGLIRDATYRTRLYSPGMITALLKKVGFVSVTIQRDFVSHSQKGDYGLMTNRMIVVARKR